MLIFYLSSRSSLGDPRAILNMEIIRNIIHYFESSDLTFLLYPLGLFYEYPDKAAHMILYTVFGFLLYLTLKNSPYPSFRDHAMLFAIAIGILYGMSDEFHQSFVPGRTASIWDLSADAIGVTLAQTFIFLKEKLCKYIITFLNPKNKVYQMNHNAKNDNLKTKIIDNLDLFFVPVFVVLSILFILIPPYNETFLRIIIALPLLLFMPGYMFIAAMFPKRGELGTIERFTMSIGLSIAITVFDGFGLNYTPWGFRPNSITISLSIIIMLLLLVTIIQRWRYGNESYSFSIGDIRSFFNILRTKERETGPEYDPALEKMLIKTMIIAILIVSAMLIYAKWTNEPEKFTALYILGANGKAEDYPTQVRVGEPSTILVGIENYEHELVNYTLLVKLAGITLTQEDIRLDHEKKWVNNVTFIPEMTSSIAFAGANKSKLEFQLLKGNVSYRSVHLLVNTTMEGFYFSELPELVNGDMETDQGWNFSNSSTNITGGYNLTPITSSRVYQINFSGEAAGAYGMIRQNISTNGTALGKLYFDIRDSEPNISYYIFKQVLLADKVIWESPAGGKNNSWEHIQVPVFFSGNSTLSFKVYSRYPINTNITIWLDNIALNPYASDGKSITTINKLPVRKEYQFNFDVRSEPFPLNGSIKIDGFKFQGFSYDLNENRSYEELNLNISQGNIIEKGNATYTTRIKGNELNLMGTSYRIFNKVNSTINISRSNIPENKTLSLDEIWTLGDYSFSIKLISSKHDSAMLEFKKSGKVLDSKLLKVGDKYEYNTKSGKNITKVFKAKVDSIGENNIYLSGIELFSEIIVLQNGTFFGDFEVVNISSDEIIFKNIYPIELKDYTTILNGNVGFRIYGENLYPYSKGSPIRGTPQNITFQNWMNISGSNFPDFYFENGTSYEELRMYFSGSGYIEEGKAIYETKVHSGSLSFLGNTYELMYPGRPGIISNITKIQNLNISINKTTVLNGYNFSYKNITNNSILLRIRRSMTKKQTGLYQQAVKSNISVFPDVNYEMFTGKFDKIKKSNILNINDSYEYREELKVDKTFKIIGGELINIGNDSIELTVRFYGMPFEIYQGKTYGDFYVYTIDSDSITMKNNKAISFKLGSETPILDDSLKIKVSSKEFLAYPLR